MLKIDLKGKNVQIKISNFLVPHRDYDVIGSVSPWVEKAKAQNFDHIW